jgi:eukaryotic-like serine/threonine-protein kinase
MQHMHAQGVVHLDLKETNVLVGRDGRLLLSDFGFSAREGAKLLVARGTPGYTAPEILQACGPGGAARGYCARSSMDVYSAGATFFGLMCGTPLTREGNGYSEGDYSDLTCAAVREEKADVHCSMDDEACRAWLAVLQGCLQRDPEQRPTAAELTAVTAQLLQRVRAAEEVHPFCVSYYAKLRHSLCGQRSRPKLCRKPRGCSGSIGRGPLASLHGGPGVPHARPSPLSPTLMIRTPPPLRRYPTRLPLKQAPQMNRA